VLLAFCTFLLILAGALVTSNDAGLSVPDWPTSFGSLYRIPPMVGGVKFEHGHRMIAQFIGLLTIILAVWTQKVDRRPWMRALGWSALGTVIAQGILGGITVLFYLPPAVSTAHATLAQTFFCIVVSMAMFTGRTWVASDVESEPVTVSQNQRPSLITLTTLSVVAVWIQLILGAAFRHNGMKLLWHLCSAAVVTFIVLWTVVHVLSHYSKIAQLRKPALFLLGLLVTQLALGFVAYLTRVVWSKDAPQPLTSMVLATVSHVAVGALVLATTVVLAIQARRHVTVANEDSVTSTHKAVTA
jgi:heme a synthase